jgi:hypothetical protein
MNKILIILYFSLPLIALSQPGPQFSAYGFAFHLDKSVTGKETFNRLDLNYMNYKLYGGKKLNENHLIGSKKNIPFKEKIFNNNSGIDSCYVLVVKSEHADAIGNFLEIELVIDGRLTIIKHKFNNVFHNWYFIGSYSIKNRSKIDLSKNLKDYGYYVDEYQRVVIDPEQKNPNHRIFEELKQNKPIEIERDNPSYALNSEIDNDTRKKQIHVFGPTGKYVLDALVIVSGDTLKRGYNLGYALPKEFEHVKHQVKLFHKDFEDVILDSVYLSSLLYFLNSKDHYYVKDGVYVPLIHGVKALMMRIKWNSKIDFPKLKQIASEIATKYGLDVISCYYCSQDTVGLTESELFSELNTFFYLGKKNRDDWTNADSSIVRSIRNDSKVDWLGVGVSYSSTLTNEVFVQFKESTSKTTIDQVLQDHQLKKLNYDKTSEKYGSYYCKLSDGVLFSNDVILSLMQNEHVKFAHPHIIGIELSE